jgi:hypothetical protein
MKKRFAQFMLMLMVAIVPYTASPYIAPASADDIVYVTCTDLTALVCTTADKVYNLSSPPVECMGGGVCCVKSSDPNHPTACDPAPPPCPYTTC